MYHEKTFEIPVDSHFISNVSLSQKTLVLQKGQKESNTIGLDKKISYCVDLEKGQFLLASLQQKNIDLEIKTYNPQGVLIESFDSPNGLNGEELVLIDATEEGRYSLQVSQLEGGVKKKGDYVLELISISDTIETHLNHVFSSLMKRNYLPGFTVSVLNDQKTLYSNAYGLANIENQVLYSMETVQCVASISKTFIGIALMQLVEQGVIQLDTPIKDLLPFEVVNPYFPDHPITIRHLATHTATINEKQFHSNAHILIDKEHFKKHKYPKYFKKKAMAAMKNEELPLPVFLEKYLSKKGKGYSKQHFFKKPPGTSWYYSNTGASLAAYLIEVVSGIPYREFVEKEVWKPMKLESASWFSNLGSNPKVNVQYDKNRSPLPKRTSITYPDGAVFMNSKDLNKYLQALMKLHSGIDGIIRSESFEEMSKIQHEEMNGQFKGLKNGLFWWQMSDGLMGHNGGDMGMYANMFFDPKTHFGFTYTCNVKPTETDNADAASGAIWSSLKRYGSYLH